jgi:oligopeptide transport system substrate-binding protein
MKKTACYCYVVMGICLLTLTACADRAPEANVEPEAQVTEETSISQEESEIESSPEPLVELSETMRKEGCTYNLYNLGWVMDWADAGNIVDTVFGPGSDFQYTFWELVYPSRADDFRDITYQAYRESDYIDRARLWGEAEDILVEDVVMVLPMSYWEDITLYNTDVNFYLPPFGQPRFSRWSSKSGVTTLVLPAAIDPPTLDATLSTDVASSMILYQLVDTPYMFTEEGSIEPLAATGFDVSEDGTVYTVHLREDALWSDGEPVLAQHFVGGVQRLLHPDTANDYAYVMMGIEGASAYASGERETLDSVKALDDYTLQFTLSEQLAYFDSLLAFSTFMPIRMDILEAYPDTYTRPGVIVSNGAYVLSEYVLGSHLTLEKNPLYWDAENVAYERIEIPIIRESATCVAAFESGEIDATTCGFPPEEIPRWVERPEFVRAPWPGLGYLGINTLAEHTQDLDFRKALAYAIDKKTYNDAVLESPWKLEARGVIPPEIYGFQGDAVGFDFDVQKAQQHLQLYMQCAEIENPSDIMIELWFIKGVEDVMEAVEAMLEGNLGIDVRLISMEFQSYVEVLDTCKGVAAQGIP